jgi:hypothetical protein
MYRRPTGSYLSVNSVLWRPAHVPKQELGCPRSGFSDLGGHSAQLEPVQTGKGDRRQLNPQSPGSSPNRRRHSQPPGSAIAPRQPQPDTCPSRLPFHTSHPGLRATRPFGPPFGLCRAAQGGFAEAEPLLVDGYQGMLQQQAAIPFENRTGISQAGQRIVQLYEGWEKPEKAAVWRAKLKLK